MSALALHSQQLMEVALQKEQTEKDLKAETNREDALFNDASSALVDGLLRATTLARCLDTAFHCSLCFASQQGRLTSGPGFNFFRKSFRLRTGCTLPLALFWSRTT